MKILFFFTFVLVLLSCGHSPLVSQFEGSDSVAVKFTELGSGKIVKVVATAEPYAVQDLLRFAGGKKTEPFKCGYDGNIVFYKKGSISGEVIFNYTGEGCEHFLIQNNGKLTATKMSNEAIDFFKALASSSK